MSGERTLADLRAEFGRNRFIAMPIAGAVAWTVAGILGATLTEGQASMALFFCMASTLPLGAIFSRFTGDDFFGKNAPKNELDGLFMKGILMSNLVWAIAIPFWMMEKSSLPLAGGVLSCLMWVPFSWIIQHWVGTFHAVSRCALIAAAWFAFPSHRFTVIPAIIVVIYLISIWALLKRKLPKPVGPAPG